MNFARFLKYWMPVFVWLGVIFVGSTDLMSVDQTSRFLIPFLRWLKPDISPEAAAQVHFLLRKLWHISEYAILAALLWRALRSTLTSAGAIAIAASAVVASAIFAASDEFHQSFALNRTASSRDVIIDVCGACIGITVCFAVSRVQRKGSARALKC